MNESIADIATEPASDCGLCPRLAAFREENREKFPDWHNAPVASFGPARAPLLIVGLAPGLRGANCTGRPFTGDFAGDLLYATLLETGFATGTYGARADDSLKLRNCRITNAVRCVPPQNKPLPLEIRTCQPFLDATIAQNRALAAILVLGRIAHDSTLRTLGARLKDYPFAHGAEHDVALPGRRALRVFDSYHCSRYNTNTGVLTPQMFRSVFERVGVFLTERKRR